MKTLALSLGAPLALIVAVTLTGCGTDQPTVAFDPGTAPSPSNSESESPTAEPTVGTYPAFEEPNYTFTVQTSCFCAGIEPIRITVRDGKVADAEMVHPKRDGDEVPEYRLITINEVIDAANNTKAAQVDVVWPSGQAWPDSVYVDQDRLMVDEEIGYTITDVTID